MLRDEQVVQILQRIQASGLHNSKLQEELLDHFCCFIEERMEAGEDFETAYRQAFLAITPNGMQEIEEEVFFLLTLKRQLNMKKILFGTGFIAAFFIAIGSMFRTFHWLSGNGLLVVGFFMLILSATLLLLASLPQMKRLGMAFGLRLVSGCLAAVLISTGSIFKILYFPTANIMFLLGVVILSFVFLPMFFYAQYKKSVLEIGK